MYTKIRRLLGSFDDPLCMVSTHGTLQQDDGLARIASISHCNRSLKLQRNPQAQQRTDLRINLCMVEVSEDFAYLNKGVVDAMPKLDPAVWMRLLYCSNQEISKPVVTH